MLPQTPGKDRSRFLLAGLVLCYGLVLLAYLTVRPLWLDEALELVGTTAPSMRAMLRWVAVNPGNAPLGYLTQRPFILFGGPSAFWARLPSVIFSLLSCVVFIRLCRELKIPRVTIGLAVVIFMMAPSQIQYSTEGRPYTEALCFCLLSMLFFVRLARTPSGATACLCIMATVAALYSQPYTVFAICGTVFWGIRRGSGKRAILCLAISVMLFLPWYLPLSHELSSLIRSAGYPTFHWTPALARDVAKGISGGSFLCSGVLIVLAVAGISSATEVAGLLLSSVILAIIGALAVDSFNDYFFAARQIIFALPGISILAAFGLQRAFHRSRMIAAICLGVFVIAALVTTVKMQINAKEDWPAAAKAIARASANGRCVHIVGGETGIVGSYRVFAPDLASRNCVSLSGQMGVVLVSNLYTGADRLEAVEAQLRGLGFVARQTVAVGGTTITIEDLQ